MENFQTPFILIYTIQPALGFKYTVTEILLHNQCSTTVSLYARFTLFYFTTFLCILQFLFRMKNIPNVPFNLTLTVLIPRDPLLPKLLSRHISASCTVLLPSTVPQGYTRPRDFLPPTSTTALLPTTAKGTRLWNKVSRDKKLWHR